MKDTLKAPLSFAQERLWFLDKYEKQQAVYNNANIVRLRGALDIDRLHGVLKTVVARHDSLRMQFLEDVGTPYIQVNSNNEVDLPLIDFTTVKPNQKEAKAQEQAVALAAKPFNLSKGNLFRFAVLRLDNRDHSLVYVVHHIISDRFSLGLWLKELIALYNGENLVKAPSYIEYASWQREQMQGETLAKKLDFWRGLLEHGDHTLELSYKPRPAVQSFDGSKHVVFLDETLSQAIRDLARQYRASLFVTVMTGFASLLYRYTGQEDFVIGTFTAGRDKAGVKNILGLFVNTLAIRLRCSATSSFISLLKDVRSTMFKSFRFQDLPFNLLLEQLEPTRDPSRSPLVQVGFNTHNVPMPKTGIDGLSFELGEVYTETSRLDLTLTLRDHGNQLELCFEYSTALFDELYIQRMSQHLTILMSAAVKNPEVRINDLPLLSEAEKHTLLAEWNNTQSNRPKNQCIHNAFSEQARRTPDATAISCNKGELTYGELDQRSDVLAEHLVKLGVDTGHIIGLSLPRGLNMITALLGILKSGAAYLPLDPDYPQERLALMLEDSGANILIGNQLNAELTKEIHLIDIETIDFAVDPPASFAKRDAIDSLAYVIYTSGSTGKPKGVMVEHCNVDNFFAAMDQVLDFKPGSEGVWVAVTSISFDISVLELLWTLTRGFKVVLQQDEALIFPLLIQHQATHFQCTPSQARMLLDEQGDMDLAFQHLKHMLIGGEALPIDIARRLIEKLDGTGTLTNVYGPTETTIWSTYHQVSLDDAVVPIGRPMINTVLYVLDEFGQVVPQGMAGELWIGGKGVVRGYLERESLTAERFQKDPFRGKGRMYRTGDKVRYREDGTLLFCGRTDFQVKLRGHRIELGEIEAHLTALEEIREAVTLVREDQPGDQRLVVYWVGMDGVDIQQAAIRDALRKSIPGYMLPNAFVRLDKIPLTPNGKIDRKALPKPEDSSDIDTQATYVEPRNNFELGLANIWQELLGQSKVGVYNNFFDLGGHSLLAVRLLAKIEQVFGRKLELPVLFNHSTIAELAEVLQKDTMDSDMSAVVALRKEGSKPPIFCILGLFLYQPLANHLNSQHPVYAIYLKSEIDDIVSGESSQTIAQMADPYVDKIREIAPKGPYYLGGLSFGGVLALEIARKLQAKGETVNLVVMFDTIRHGSLQLQPVRRICYNLNRIMRQCAGFLVDKVNGLISGSKTKPLNNASDTQESVLIDGPLPLQEKRNRFFLNKLRQYQPIPYDGPVLLFKAAHSPVNKLPGYKLDPNNGWSEIIKDLNTIEIAGDHTSIIQEPNIQVLAAILQAQLERYK